MATGTVKWFNPTKGYGFITPDGGGKDVFVHITAVEAAGMGTLSEGQKINYEVVSEERGDKATELSAGEGVLMAPGAPSSLERADATARTETACG